MKVLGHGPVSVPLVAMITGGDHWVTTRRNTPKSAWGMTDFSFMQAFILIMMCCVTLSDFLVQRFNLPPLLRFLPEVMSGISILWVLVAGTRERFQLVAPKYWVILFGLALVIACSVVNNNPGPGPLISGLRFYFRAAPFFLLPMVHPMTDIQLGRQLKLLLVLAFVQLPVAAYQRWVIFSADRVSGDDVRGTIMDSGVLSMFLICGALILTGMVLKRRIGVVRYAFVFLLLLFPTTINETKVTIVLVPLGLLVTLILGAERGRRLQYAGLTMAVLVLFGAIFVPIYNRFEEGQVNIIDFFTNEKTLDRYLVSQGGGKGVGLGGKKIAHRGESITIPTKYLAKDPVSLAFGLGLGNVSPSLSGKNFEGAYFKLFESVLTISFTFFLLEFGLLGVLLIGALNWMIFADSLSVSRRDHTVTGGLAAGWTGVVAVFAVSIFYNNFHFFVSITYLYWYFSGVICARREALRRGLVADSLSAEDAAIRA